MAIEFDFGESNYKFTDPVRKFKENDPYQWEIDNIPIEQLEDNVRWLKDQITNGSLKFSDVDRSLLSDLKPYATGGDRVVRVKPGRFSGRVNDAYNKPTISNVILSGVETGNPGIYTDDKDADFYVTLAANLIYQTSYDSAKALNLNGLETLASIWSTNGPELAQDVEYEDGELKYSATSKLQNAVPPGTNKQVLIKDLVDALNLTHQNFHDHQAIHNLLVQKWRGVGRLAIVDIPDELTLEVDAFSDADFDSTTIPSSAYRIDLVFIYTHPVDASSTTISKKEGGAAKTITKAELGVVKGAGYIYANNTTNDGTADKSILANINDLASDANTGVSGVHGSFPAPDDLMNIAPLLMEQLETTDERLIGQSILPVAYVVVKKSTTSTTTTGKGIIEATDVIDIRPFLRTAELTYGERAGLAAANPPLNFANPVVGKSELYDTEGRLLQYFNENQTQLLSKSAVWAKGIIFGGFKYGPEGTLYRLAGKGEDYITFDSTELGLQLPVINGSQRVIPYLPEWDTAGSNPAGMLDAAEFINLKVIDCDTSLAPGSFTNEGYNAVAPGMDQSEAKPEYDYRGNLVVLRMVTKKIEVTLPDWAVDYDVNIQLENCVQVASPGGGAGGAGVLSLGMHHSGLFVSKRKIYNNKAIFTIGCTLGGITGSTVPKAGAEQNLNLRPNMTSTNLHRYASFSVPYLDSVGDLAYDSKNLYDTPDFFVKTGLCLFPSVSFTVTAYDTDNVKFDGGSTT